MAKRPSPKKIKAEKRLFKQAFVDKKKEFEDVETSIENKEKRLWKFFRPMKELGKKKLKRGKQVHIKHKHR